MQLRAPAKINLSFKILNRRADGFHEIETLMARVSLFDTITIELREGNGEIQFLCDDASLPTGDNNLVVRAARAFSQQVEMGCGVNINLQKKVPHGAGLGGGSSDAAAVLLGLNRHFDLRLSLDQLIPIAATIGSDVPFFLFESSAVCRGRGELVTPASMAQKLPLLLLKPAFGVPTPWAYWRWRESKELPGVDYGPQRFAGIEFVNDLERPVFEKFVFLAHLKEWLRAQPEVGAAMLSGSGSTMFTVLREGTDAEALADRARAELDPELWSCACETI